MIRPALGLCSFESKSTHVLLTTWLLSGVILLHCPCSSWGIIESPPARQYLLTTRITFSVKQRATVINFFLPANYNPNPRRRNYQITINTQKFVLVTRVEDIKEGLVFFFIFIQVNEAQIQIISPSALRLYTCLTVLSERRKVNFSL